MKLILLPGMGADERLFEPQRKVFPDLIVPPWLRPDSSESLTDYARRFAEQLPTGEPFVVGGASFGGMVAAEIARLTSPEGLVLLGSCIHPKDIAPHLYFASAFVGLFPDSFFRVPRIIEPILARKFGAAAVTHSDIVLGMLRDADASFVKWACTAVCDWRGVRDLQVPIYHIHGSDDQLIPVERVSADRIIKGAGHLLNLTHSGDVNDFLRGVIGITP